MAQYILVTTEGKSTYLLKLRGGKLTFVTPEEEEIHIQALVDGKSFLSPDKIRQSSDLEGKYLRFHYGAMVFSKNAQTSRVQTAQFLPLINPIRKAMKVA